MPSMTTGIDQADVATVLQLENQLKSLRPHLDQALAAAQRLDEAGYAGAGRLVDDLRAMLVDRCDGGLVVTLEELDELRVAGGDRAALDYYQLVEKKGLTVPAAAARLLEEDADDAHLDRIEALRRYAASRARPS